MPEEKMKDELSIREVVRKATNWYNYLRSKIKIISLFIFSGILLGIGYSLIKKPVYTGTLTFVLENTGKSKLSGYSSIAAQFGLSIGDNAGGLFLIDDNIIAFMQSRSMVAKTLLTPVETNGKKDLLINRYIAYNGYRSDWRKNKRLSSVVFHQQPQSMLEDSLITVFYNDIREHNLSVSKPDKKADVIYVTTNSEDELFSKNFTETLLNNVTNFYIETQTKKTGENVAILQRQVDSVQNLLNSALTGVAISNDANPNANPALQRLRVPSQRKMVEVEMNRAILEELVKNLELAKITLRRETPLVQVIDRPVLPLYKKKFGIIKGIVIGGFISGFLVIFFLTVRLYWKKITR